MSEDDTIDPADSGKVLAAEYVLGVLSAAGARGSAPAYARACARSRGGVLGRAAGRARRRGGAGCTARCGLVAHRGRHRPARPAAGIGVAEPGILAQLRHRLGAARRREHCGARLYRPRAHGTRAADGDAQRKRGSAELRRRDHGDRQQPDDRTGVVADHRSARDRAVADPGVVKRQVRSLGSSCPASRSSSISAQTSRRPPNPGRELAVSLEPPGGSPRAPPARPLPGQAGRL